MEVEEGNAILIKKEKGAVGEQQTPRAGLSIQPA
jgi:hypothetical protein